MHNTNTTDKQIVISSDVRTCLITKVLGGKGHYISDVFCLSTIQREWFSQKIVEECFDFLFWDKYLRTDYRSVFGNQFILAYVTVCSGHNMSNSGSEEVPGLYQRITRNESLLQELLSQQKISKSNMEKMGGMLQAISQQLESLTFPRSSCRSHHLRQCFF